jgi:hypothetical protein
MPRRKMQIKDTAIPAAATQEYCKGLTRCERYKRSCARCCCAKNRTIMTEDLMKKESLRKFTLRESFATQKSPSDTNTIKGQERRQHIFDSQAPAYNSYLSNAQMPPK